MLQRHFVSFLLLVSLILLTPLLTLAEQPILRAVPRQLPVPPPSKLIPPRPFTVSKGSMEQLAKTPVQLPGQLTPQEQEGLREIATLIMAKNLTGANNRWATLLAGLNQKNVPVDISELIQYVLRESYLQTSRDLQQYADKVKQINAQKERLRQEIDNLRQQLQRASALRPPQPPPPVSTLQLTNSIKQFEQKLASIGDDAQLANIDLQNMLQKQQQMLQTLSNISKQLSDSAMAVIRKIG